MKAVICVRYSLSKQLEDEMHKSFGAVAKFICSTFAAVIKKLWLFSSIYGNNARIGFV